MVHAKSTHTVSPGSLLSNTTWVSLDPTLSISQPVFIIVAHCHTSSEFLLYTGLQHQCELLFIHSFIYLLHHVTNRMLVLVWFPYRQLNVCPQQWKCGVQTTRPPGSTVNVCFCVNGIHSALNLTSIAIEPMWTNENY